MMKKIFVVDDNSTNLLRAEEALSNHYEVYTLSSASIMFEVLENIIPDLILLDIMMPDIDGFGALATLKADVRYAGIPVVFLTSKNDEATEVSGFEMGVIDFISKPFSAPVLLNRIKTHLQIEGIIRDRTKKLLKLQNSLVSVLANMIERRDTLTGNHVERTTRYLRILMEAMLERGLHAKQIEEWDFETAVSSARLHDIGKIAVSDLILNKPGKLEPEEFEIMKTHSAEGEKIIDHLIAESGDDIFLQNAKLFAGCHHEKWDGKGYPRGLSGEGIPLQGRIMAIGDVYDALVSDRPYKKAFTHEKAVEIIRESSGSHFDPQIVDVFLDIHTQFAEVAQ
jgi:putative two-component system response regulator